MPASSNVAFHRQGMGPEFKSESENSALARCQRQDCGNDRRIQTKGLASCNDRGIICASKEVKVERDRDGKSESPFSGQPS